MVPFRQRACEIGAGATGGGEGGHTKAAEEILSEACAILATIFTTIHVRTHARTHTHALTHARVPAHKIQPLRDLDHIHKREARARTHVKIDHAPCDHASRGEKVRT